MLKWTLLIDGIISFIVGGLIVLVGIGAIVGCAGGLMLLLAGGLIFLTGIGAFGNFGKLKSARPTPRVNDVIELIKRNGTWVAG